ncbi:unnamed protein product [Sphenostylis stenocarpa]|uniref:Uncharacterized protein n=1 Tax=Sphenostylis stenocarpa TaxID=92480 RepID=A0AA87BB03_9FABA|nr:unnamed protein product [Sphenostylis stenocarpa]
MLLLLPLVHTLALHDQNIGEEEGMSAALGWMQWSYGKEHTAEDVASNHSWAWIGELLQAHQIVVLRSFFAISRLLLHFAFLGTGWVWKGNII